MSNLKIHHISINVSDLIKSQNFYHLLGFRECHNYVSDKGEVKILHLLKEEFILELFCYSNAPVSATVSGKVKHSEFVGIEHFSLHADDIENAYQIFNEYIVEDKGVQSGRTGIRFFFIADPDGNKIEIVEDKRDLTITKSIIK